MALRCFFISVFIMLFSSLLSSAFTSNPSVPSLSKEILECIEPALVEHLNRAYAALREGRTTDAEIHARLASIPETLRISFLTKGVDSARENELKRWTIAALEAWNDAQNVTRFREALPDERSDIVICFSDYGMRRNIAGSIFWSRRVWRNSLGIRMQLYAEIRIANRRPNGSLMDENQIRHAIQHELGHLLGLKEGIAPTMRGVPITGSRVGLGQKEAAAIEEFQAHVTALTVSIPQPASKRKTPVIFRFAQP